MRSLMSEILCGAVPAAVQARPRLSHCRLGIVLLACILGMLAGLLKSPLGTNIKIGADEDFELAKPILCLSGHEMYTQVWDDQPPLYTFLILQAAKHISYSVLWPRLITGAFALLMLTAGFLMLNRARGLAVAVVGIIVVIASPGFIELSCSCMQEIPALAPVVAALCVLFAGRRSKWGITEIIAGVIFAVGLQIKYIGIVYWPLVLLLIWLRHRAPDRVLKGTLVSLFAFAVGAVAAFLAINLITGSPLLLQLEQSWAAHFAGNKSFEYGSPADHPFDWAVLLKNWDTTLPAAVGVWFLVKRIWRGVRGGQRAEGRREKCDVSGQKSSGSEAEFRLSLLLLAWVGLTLVLFPFHKPWWQYYYIHNALPLCLCAAVGIVGMWDEVRGQGSVVSGQPSAVKASRGAGKARPRGTRLRRVAVVVFALYLLCAVPWMGGRVYLQVSGIRNSPKTYASLVLKELERFKPLTNFLFTDQPVYSFHSGIPMPPNLAILSLKRFWTGDMTNARLVAELETVKPGLILVKNETRELPYQDLLDREYRLVYQDSADNLYAHRSIANKAKY